MDLLTLGRRVRGEQKKTRGENKVKLVRKTNSLQFTKCAGIIERKEVGIAVWARFASSTLGPGRFIRWGEKTFPEWRGFWNSRCRAGEIYKSFEL